MNNGNPGPGYPVFSDAAYPSAPSAPAPPPPYAPSIDPNVVFRSVIAKYEINQVFADKLQMLNGFKICFIFDDSGSMNTALQDSPLNQPNQMKATRWDELKYFANISLEIASLFDPQGCDVFFLNRPPARGITLQTLPDFLNSFARTKPSGYTPLAQTLTQVLNENANIVRAEKKLLIVIVTDGEPTDQSGNVNINQFKQCLQSRNPIDRIFVNIVACTDDDSSMDYLNKWDREIKHLDVVDDFRSEREEVRKAKGPSFRFSYGDYVVKSLVGSVDPELDNFDERVVNDGCCIII